MAHTNDTVLIAAPTYAAYDSFLQENAEQIKLKNYPYYLEKYGLVNDVFQVLPCVVYMLDYQTKQYTYLGGACEGILGYAAEEFTDKGDAFFKRNMHPDDMAIFSNQVFKKYIRCVRTSSEEGIKQARFSLNYRFKRKDGVYIQLWRQYMVLEVNKQNYPVLELGFCFDVSAHKKDNKVIFSVSKPDKLSGFLTTTADSFPDNGIAISAREREVIKCLLAGLGSKEIGDILNISPYTVIAHRRNILKKVHCKNTSELIRYAMANGMV